MDENTPKKAHFSHLIDILKKNLIQPISIQTIYFCVIQRKIKKL